MTQLDAVDLGRRLARKDYEPTVAAQQLRMRELHFRMYERRVPVERFTQLIRLFYPLADEMHGVLGRFFTRQGRYIRLFKLLRHIAAGYAVIF